MRPGGVAETVRDASATIVEIGLDDAVGTWPRQPFDAGDA
jgi:hypothetical protein